MVTALRIMVAPLSSTANGDAGRHKSLPVVLLVQISVDSLDVRITNDYTSPLNPDSSDAEDQMTRRSSLSSISVYSG